MSLPVLWICGPSGVGKTAVGWEIHEQLLRDGVESAYVDIDQLGMCYPEPDDDPGRYGMKTRNAAAVVANFQAAGAQSVVISGVIDPVRGVERDSFPDATLTRCWLAADADELRRRFLRRGTRREQIDEALRQASTGSDLADVVVDTSGRSVQDVVASVRQHAGGWPEVGRSAGSHTPSVRAVDGPVLWLVGPRGAGTSTVGFTVYLRVLRTGPMTGYVDVGQLGFIGRDTDNRRLQAANLAAVLRTYRNAGAQGSIAVGGVRGEVDIASYEDALPAATITWCRLHATGERLTERILLRGRGEGSWPEPGDRLKGRPAADLLRIARRSAADADALDHASVGLRFDTDGRAIDEIADEILTRTRWTATPSQ